MKYTFIKTRTLAELKHRVGQQQNESSAAATHIKSILEGNLNNEVEEILQSTPLGVALQSLQDHLATISIAEKERAWLNTGLAKFADILRNKQSLEFSRLADDILANVVKHVDANQGALFVYENSGTADEHIQMIACYAYGRKKHQQKRINVGEGLVGQCVLEKDVIYLKEVPKDFVSITSGLGEAPPREVLITPMLINEQVYGVLELASFQEFPQYKIEFVKKLSENIASTIKTARENERIVNLLNSSQQQAEELRAQEEEMRQNMEELQATQEEMQRKNEETLRAAAEMKSILNGINATMATIEFSPDGYILTANSNFLSTVKYKLEEIKGRHHRMFVPPDVLSSDDYKIFWSQLAAGKAISGVFKRVAADGNIIWLNAIYNPTFNSKGDVVKIVKFATDITAQHELLAESNGMMKGINATMGVIEFTPKGDVIQANENFLRTMNYSLEQIKGKHHRIFVPDDIAQSRDYQTFWESLAAGEAITGEFKRKTSDNRLLRLKAIYNPIFTSTGKVKKIVKFVTTTDSEPN